MMTIIFFILGIISGATPVYFLCRYHYEKIIKSNWKNYLDDMNSLRTGSKNLVAINKRLQNKLAKKTKPVSIVLSGRN